MLTKDRFKTLTDLPYEEHDVPEWNDKVRIGMLPAGRWVDFANKLDLAPGAKQDMAIMFDILAYCLRDTNGELLCDSPEDLHGKNMFVLQRLFEIALEVNGMTEGSVDAAEKNSDAAPNSD